MTEDGVRFLILVFLIVATAALVTSVVLLSILLHVVKSRTRYTKYIAAVQEWTAATKEYPPGDPNLPERPYREDFM